MGITPGQPGRADSFINESERNATPAEDVGKVVKLESDGRFHQDFIPVKPLNVQEFETPGAFTWTKPSEGTFAIIEIQGAGGSGGVVTTTSDNTARGAGGGGGAYIKILAKLSELASSIDGTIGTGGTAVTRSTTGGTNGNAGGNTIFNSITVQGGNGGQGTTAGDATGGEGGVQVAFGENGGAGANSTTSIPVPHAPNTILSAPGGGAARRSGSTSGVSNGGTAMFGTGVGGNGAAGASSVTASSGIRGAGGGGAATNFGPHSTTSGAGGDGFVRITVF